MLNRDVEVRKNLVVRLYHLKKIKWECIRMDVQKPYLEISFNCGYLRKKLQKVAPSIPVRTIGSKVLGDEVDFLDSALCKVSRLIENSALRS